MQKKTAKQIYIEQEILKILQSWGGIAIIGGAVVFLLLSTLDYFVTPENFLRFLIYRLSSAFLFISIYYLNKQKTNKLYQISLFIVGTLIASITVELMILSFGAHQSIYYAGMIIILIFCLGFLPLFSIKTTIALAAITYLTYLLPILILDNITNLKVFINNNIFLIATAIIGIIWRYYNDSLVRKNLSRIRSFKRQRAARKVFTTP